jgi:hypothetical protein
MIGRHVTRLLSAYADDELSVAEAERVQAHLAACATCRAEWEKLRADMALVAEAVTRVEPPPALWDSLHGVHAEVQRTRVPVGSTGARVYGLRWITSKLPATGAIVALGLAAAGVVLFLGTSTSPMSAAAVLDTSDAALIRIAKPGELLHRSWRVTRLITKPDAQPERGDWRMDSWLGGENLNRGVTRITASDGRLLSIGVSESADGASRGYTYFTHDYPEELHGVRLDYPTRAELRQTLQTLPAGDDRARLERLFDASLRPDSGSLLVWEHRENRALLEAPARQPSLGLRIILSLEPAVMPNGDAAHVVKQLTLGAPWVNWRADGTPWFQLARVNMNHYISKSSFLTLKYESDVDLEDGSRRVSSTELESIQSVRPDAAGDPFAVVIPPGTPVIHISTRDYLVKLSDMLRRSAAKVGEQTHAR